MPTFKGVLPAQRQVPAPYGLLSVADVTRPGGNDEHWIGGFDVESEACSFNADIVDICGGEDPISVHDAPDDAMRSINVQPFGIQAQDECLTPGWTVEDRKARVLRQLELITPKAVESELWNGLYRQAVDGDELGRYLSSDSADVVDPAAQKAIVGLALLEQALATCSPGFQGVIHLSPLLGTILGEHLNHDANDDYLITYNGNKVAVGVGYDGRGPGANVPPVDPTVHWMYATGPVQVRLGPTELVTPALSDATNPITNVMTYVAERPASIVWDGCCHLAISVDVTL